MSVGSRISNMDWITTIHIRVHGLVKHEVCYETLLRIAPYLESAEWQHATTGHYLNIIEKSSGPALRIAFFASTEVEALRAKALLEAQCGQIHASQILYEPPTQTVFTQNYGGDESHFRNYLAAYSQIVVEIIHDRGILYTRRLFALFCFQVVAAGRSSRPFLEPVFERTPTYSEFDKEQQDYFWEAVDFNRSWVHMLINLGVGADWPRQGDSSKVWPLQRINDLLTYCGMGFTIPPDWQP